VLRKTFIHVPGIGRTTERSLWKQGCADWSCYDGRSFSTGRADRGEVKAFLERSEHALSLGEHQFFRKHLGMKDAWRGYEEFKSSAVYLDIETDGSAITTIGLYDGQRFTVLLKGENLENVRDELSRYSMIVTFCGGTFDLPAIERSFRGITLDHLHIDLCPLLRRLGFKGGLKKIEKEVGIERPAGLAGLNGYDAVLLWRRFRMLGDETALDKLVAYNREDCVNLHRLAELAVSRMRADVFEEVTAK